MLTGAEPLERVELQCGQTVSPRAAPGEGGHMRAFSPGAPAPVSKRSMVPLQRGEAQSSPTPHAGMNAWK